MVQQEYICMKCGSTSCGEMNCGKLITCYLGTMDYISVQQLADEFLKSEEKSCVCSHDTCLTKKQLISCPPTIIVTIGRFSYETFSMKNSDYVEVSHDLYLECENQIIKYQLKSVVCHHGTSDQQGHYTAVIRHGDQFVSCSDMSLSFTADNLNRSCYIVIYDRVDKELPLYTRAVLNSLFATSGFKCMYNDFQHDKHKLSGVKINQCLEYSKEIEGDITKYIWHKMDQYRRKYNVIDPCVFLDLYLQQLFDIKGNSVGCLSLAENFETLRLEFKSCSECHEKAVHCDNIFIIHIKQFSVHDICKQIMKPSDSNRFCKCPEETSSVFCKKCTQYFDC